MDIVQRAKSIVLSPKSEWDNIAAEQTTISDIYRRYVVYLAAIPVVAAFIGLSIIGVGAMGFSYRVPFGTGLVNMVLSFVMMLVMLYVMALITDALAPTFSGQRNLTAAFKVIAYGSTASMLAGIFSMLPALSILALLGALYSVYLIYVGLPVLMKCSQEKALPYTAVLVVAGIVAGIVMAGVTALITPNPLKQAMSSPGTIAIQTPQGEVKVDTRKMEELAKRMEAASKSGDPAAAMKAAGEAIAAATGGGNRAPADPATLKAMLPETIDGLPRVEYEAQTGSPMGVQGSTAKARYREGNRSIKLEIVDVGGLSGVLAMASAMNMSGERETETTRERTYKQGNRTIHEKVHKNGQGGEMRVLLANGVMVEIAGTNVDANVLKEALGRLDLTRLEAGKT